jgi:hypothetical protein
MRHDASLPARSIDPYLQWLAPQLLFQILITQVQQVCAECKGGRVQEQATVSGGAGGNTQYRLCHPRPCVIYLVQRSRFP